MTGVAADSVHEGEAAAQWLIKQQDGKPCNVVELQGTVGASVALDRKKGFLDTVSAVPTIKIIRTPVRRLHPQQGQGGDGELHQGGK